MVSLLPITLRGNLEMNALCSRVRQSTPLRAADQRRRAPDNGPRTGSSRVTVRVTVQPREGPGGRGTTHACAEAHAYAALRAAAGGRRGSGGGVVSRVHPGEGGAPRVGTRVRGGDARHTVLHTPRWQTG